MKNKIQIKNSKFTFDESSDEYIGELNVWGKATTIFLNIKDNKEDVSNIVIEKINWLNDNRDKIIDIFMERNGHYVDFINRLIGSGDFKSEKSISETDFINAIFVNNISIWIEDGELDLSLDLEAEPDYLLGHLACVEIDKDNEIEFGGMNG